MKKNIFDKYQILILIISVAHQQIKNYINSRFYYIRPTYVLLDVKKKRENVTICHLRNTVTRTGFKTLPGLCAPPPQTRHRWPHHR